MKIQRFASANIKSLPIDDARAVDVDRAAIRNRTSRNASDIALYDFTARRHGEDARRQREADGCCKESFS